MCPSGLFTATFGEKDADKELLSFLQIEGESLLLRVFGRDLCVCCKSVFFLFVSTAAVREEKNDAVSNQCFAACDVFSSSPDQPVLHRGGSIFGGGEAVVW